MASLAKPPARDVLEGWKLEVFGDCIHYIEILEIIDRLTTCDRREFALPGRC